MAVVVFSCCSGLVTGCDDRLDGYIPVKEIVRNGFLIEREATDELSGKEVGTLTGIYLEITSSQYIQLTLDRE